MEKIPQPLRVLIVEDNEADAELTVHELQRQGFALTWRRVDTEPAYLAALGSGVDLIISDYHMPQFTGLRALHLLRERGLEIPFIIVSGTIGEETAVDAMRQGATDYLLKGWLARLGPAIGRALEESRVREERRQSA
jgi:DNA-binding NtrC family response regulator